MGCSSKDAPSGFLFLTHFLEKLRVNGLGNGKLRGSWWMQLLFRPLINDFLRKMAKFRYQ